MSKTGMTREEVFRLIDAERDAQRKKWREEENEFRGDKLAVLMEEVGEVAKSMLEDEGKERLKAELIQVAAVAVKWVQTL
jgi:NTP pyrophosphatase (non-canonical NTP hydrolase)